MRWSVLAAALLAGLPLHAQETGDAAKKKKKAVPPTPAHQQASKDQIRKFNQLQKKQPQK